MPDRAEAGFDYEAYKAISDAYWDTFDAKLEHELEAWNARCTATRTPVTYESCLLFISGETFNTLSDDEELEVQAGISIKNTPDDSSTRGGTNKPSDDEADIFRISTAPWNPAGTVAAALAQNWEAFEDKLEHERDAWKAICATTCTPVGHESFLLFIARETFNTPTDDEKLKVQAGIYVKNTPEDPNTGGGDHHHNF